jgi:hypothetical protein
MFDALAHIEIVGTKATGDQHSSVVDSIMRVIRLLNHE